MAGELLTMKDAAAVLGVSAKTFSKHWKKAGGRTLTFGNRAYVPRQDLERWLADGKPAQRAGER